METVCDNKDDKKDVDGLKPAVAHSFLHRGMFYSISVTSECIFKCPFPQLSSRINTGANV